MKTKTQWTKNRDFFGCSWKPFFARVIYCSFWFIWSLVKFSSRTLYHQSRVITCVGSKSSWAARTSSRWTRCSIFFRNPFFNYYSSSFCQNKFSPLPAWNSILGLFSNDFLFFSPFVLTFDFFDNQSLIKARQIGH